MGLLVPWCASLHALVGTAHFSWSIAVAQGAPSCRSGTETSECGFKKSIPHIADANNFLPACACHCQAGLVIVGYYSKRGKRVSPCSASSTRWPHTRGNGRPPIPSKCGDVLCHRPRRRPFRCRDVFHRVWHSHIRRLLVFHRTSPESATDLPA